MPIRRVGDRKSFGGSPERVVEHDEAAICGELGDTLSAVREAQCGYQVKTEQIAALIVYGWRLLSY
jgi:hypothetical protein